MRRSGALTPAAHDPALARLWDALPAARLVGGAVRDLLAGRPVADWDLATPDPPEAVERVLAAAGIRTVPTGIAHGTLTAIVDGRPCEITTLRRDVATDGRHAAIEWTADWREDAARRDFTINAMSLDRAGGLHDFFGGAADLRGGIVRFVGEAAARIAEDHLRILRFFRFFARYGSGAPDADAARAIRAGARLVERLSPERVWSELKRLLAAPDPEAAVALADALGVLPAVLTEGANLPRFRRLRAIGAPPDPLLRLAGLMEGDPGALARRLRLAGEEARRLAALRDAPRAQPGLGEGDRRRLLADLPADLLVAATWLAQAEAGAPAASDASAPHGPGGAVPGSRSSMPGGPPGLSAPAAALSDGRSAGASAPQTPPRDADTPPVSSADAWTALRAALATAVRPAFPLAGRDAVAAGLAPGPAVGVLLAEIRAWWLAGGAVADRAAALRELRARLPAGPPALSPGTDG